MVERYQEALLSSMKEGGKKAMNMSKPPRCSRDQKGAQANFMRDYAECSALTLPSTQKPQRSNGWLMQPLLARPRETPDMSYKSWRASLE